MWRLSWFHYREVIKKLRNFWFEFYREAKWSHEIWFNNVTNLYTTVPRHNGDMPEWTLRSILWQAKIDVNDFLSN